MMTSRLVQMQARIQQKQIEEREEKLLKIYENQQQKAFERVNRSSAGSNTSLGSTGGGKVRQMFDERRKAGIDKSYPLEPLKGRNGTVQSSKTTVRQTSVQKVGQIRNGKPLGVKTEAKQSIYNNNNGKESYQEKRFVNDQRQFRDDDVIEMMNDHNLNDSIEREEMPVIGFDEPDFSFTGKLANLGGKLPSEKAADAKKNAREAMGKTFRKETKPIVKRIVRGIGEPELLPTASQRLVSVNQQVSPNSKSATQIMSAKKSAQQVPKAPSNAKPSAKQTGKAPVQRDDLTACKFCNRRFGTERIGVHENICGQTMRKKRKAYDATKHRLQGTELEPYVKKGAPKAQGKAPVQKQSSAHKKDWRRTHEEFINAIRAAKQAQMHVAKGGKLSDLPPPPPSSNPDYVQCPHCGRKFNESAAERHIPKCASYQFNKPKGPPPKAGKHF